MVGSRKCAKHSKLPSCNTSWGRQSRSQPGRTRASIASRRVMASFAADVRRNLLMY
ncbi:conserved hypothetical protein [Ricinus communis]|uniref:Uncharacterized protein n=1 Tax=Ricinus communis TaxID=3988 RepID=B9TE10_RICCO|nr:conserved hypothetical protein [Ricinus communis]